MEEGPFSTTSPLNPHIDIEQTGAKENMWRKGGVWLDRRDNNFSLLTSSSSILFLPFSNPGGDAVVSAAGSWPGKG